MRITLLGAAQEPFLDRRAAIAHGEHMPVVDRQLVEQFADDAAFGVLAYDGRQNRLCSQGGSHRGDAAGAAEAMLLLANPKNRDRRFGANGSTSPQR